MRKVLTMLTILSLAALALVACAAPGASADEGPAASEGPASSDAPPPSEGAGEAESAAPAGSLDGTSWLLTGIDGGEGAAAPAAGRGEPIFRFEEGRIAGSAGCNRLVGGYTQEGESFSVGAMAGTRMACPEPLMTQESTVSAILSAAERAVVDGDTLTISTADGRSLSFSRA